MALAGAASARPAARRCGSTTPATPMRSIRWPPRSTRRCPRHRRGPILCWATRRPGFRSPTAPMTPITSSIPTRGSNSGTAGWGFARKRNCNSGFQPARLKPGVTKSLRGPAVSAPNRTHVPGDVDRRSRRDEKCDADMDEAGCSDGCAFNGRNNPDHFFWGKIANQIGRGEQIRLGWGPASA